MRHITRALLSTSVIVAAAWVGSAEGADQVVVNADGSPRAASASDLASARAYRNPLQAPSTSQVKAEPVSAQLEPGARTPAAASAAATEDKASARAFGSFGLPYASTRVALGSSNAANTGPNYLSTTYPYRTVGKLTFSSSYCSASLIRRSVIVTAAHCIQNFGSGSSVFSNFQFTPGHYGPGSTAAQVAPYGTWTWRAFVRPASWASGTDVGSGAARDNDVAVIALGKNSRNQFVGDLTGYLGYGWNNYSFVSSPRTGNLAVASTATLGYPGLLDFGRIMQRADGPTYATTIGGAGQLWQGSDFTGGSSGGPWIVNFRSANPALSGGAVIGTAASMVVVGVTSWGSADPNAPKDNYSSQFRQNSRYPGAAYGTYGAGNIGSLLNTLCNAPAQGSQTYAQLGYCD